MRRSQDCSRKATHDPKDLLTPEVLSHFFEELPDIATHPLPAAVAAAAEEAKQGRPESMLARLSGETKDDPRVAFLRGVALPRPATRPAARTQLEAALRGRSDFFGAAVYLGACHAAGGKDADAIGAWQTALIGASRAAPRCMPVLSDALQRTRESDEALKTLEEGLEAFPEDAGCDVGSRWLVPRRETRRRSSCSRAGWTRTPRTRRRCSRRLRLLFDGFSRAARVRQRRSSSGCDATRRRTWTAKGRTARSSSAGFATWSRARGVVR